ncbi:MAG: hypothetical protein ABJC79_05395 [Acidimicrobiia bacterium]
MVAVHAETSRLQVETLRSELGELHREVARRDIELLRALFDIAAVNTDLRKQLEIEQSNRADLTRAIDRLAMFAAAPALPRTIDIGPTVPTADHGAGSIIGGSIVPGEIGVDEPASGTIDLTTEPAVDLPVAPSTRAETPLECEVHLQFGDRWINGFQIEETIRSGNVTQFRLRRQVDGWVLPELFDETEVRVFMQPVVDGS